MPIEALLLGLGASLAFSLSTLSFKKFSIEVSPLWMNAFKCAVAGAAFLVAAALVGDLRHILRWNVIVALGLSGFLGLNVGDLFLMRSFREIGSGRTLMIFSFSPLFLGVASYFLFGTALKPSLWAGIFLLSCCIMLLGLEHFRREGSWSLRGYTQALAAVLLDSTGILLTRWAIGQDSQMGLAQANLIRCAGALVGFAVLSRYYPIYLWPRFLALGNRLRGWVLLVSLTGTFLSLYLWIGAIRLGPVGVIAALAAVGPLLVTCIETYTDRRPITRHLILAAGCFVAGVLVINLL